MRNWEKAQEWEKDWHGTCVNKVAGEWHQVSFIAPRMGLVRAPIVKGAYEFDMQGVSVLDIGGGAASLLLKCKNVEGKVIDPIRFPDWVYARYDCAGIKWEIEKGENITENGYDEVWIYNCLQHAEDPKQVIDAARRAGKLIRIYEYINIPVSPGHIHTLKEEDLNRWLGGEGRTEENKRYYGVFPSNINTAAYWDRIYRKEGIDTWRVKNKLNDYVLSEIQGSVLELGCGVGVLAREIESDYLGLDISPVAVKMMKDQGFKAEIKEVPPIGVEGFDTIVGLELLEHLDADERLDVITEAAKLCNKAIFSVPDNCMPPEEVAEHRTMYNKSSFEWFLYLALDNVRVTPIQDNGVGYLVGIGESRG